MRCAFICSSLEQGRDGVGDHTLNQACEFQSLGHQVVCIAAHDKHLNQPGYTSSTVDISDQSIKIYRFSSQQSWHRKASLIRSTLQMFGPDWISFQYVGYGYHTYGLPMGLLWLLPLSGLAKWHIMIHETWLLLTPRWRDKVLSHLQKAFLHCFLIAFRPILLTTSNQHYQKMIAVLGFDSTILNIPSSIALCSECMPNDIPADEWRFLFFGALPSSWDLKTFFGKIEDLRLRLGIRVCRFIIAGRTLVGPDQLLQALKADAYPSFIFDYIGELEANDLSCLMQSVDYGISKTPRSMIEKSAAVAAMRYHNLPVFIAVDELKTKFDPTALPQQEDVFPLASDYSKALSRPSRKEALTRYTQDRFSPAHIARLLLNLMESYGSR